MENIKQVWPKWEVLEVLGQGGFGTVYKAKRENFGDVSYAAIKVVKIPSNRSELKEMTGSGLSEAHIKDYYKKSIMSMIDEIKMMSKFKTASHIVSIEDFEVVENSDGIGGIIYIRMELLKNISDYFDFGNVKQDEVIKMALDILTALEFCHKQNVVHRDIKPGNIFISEFGEFKLGDFGISREVEKTNATMSQKGTKSYMAPEMIRMEKYGKNVDLYALGLTMYELLNHGRIPFLPPFPEPFYPLDREEAMIKRLMGEEFPDIAGIGELNAIIKKACHPDSSKRYGDATEMKEALLSLGKEKVPEEKESYIFDEKTSGNENSLFNEDKPLFEDQSTIGSFKDLPFEKETKKQSKEITVEDILEYVINKFSKENNINLKKDVLACQRLEDTIDNQMTAFNKSGKMVLDLPYFTKGLEGALHLEMTIEKHNFNKSSHQGIDGWLFDDVKQENHSSKQQDNEWNVHAQNKVIKHSRSCPYCGKNSLLAMSDIFICGGCHKFINDGLPENKFNSLAQLYNNYMSAYSNKNYQLALNYLKQIEAIDPDSAQNHMRKGQIYGALNDRKSQLASLLKALKLDNEDAITYNELAHYYINVERNYDKAYEYSKKAYELMSKGYNYMTLFNSEEAICDNYSIALEYTNRSIEAHKILNELNDYRYEYCNSLAVDWGVGSGYYKMLVSDLVENKFTNWSRNGWVYDEDKKNQSRNVLGIQQNAIIIFALAGEKLFGPAYTFALSHLAIHFYTHDKQKFYMPYYDFMHYAITCKNKRITLQNKSNLNQVYEIDTGQDTNLIYQLLHALQKKVKQDAQ